MSTDLYQDKFKKLNWTAIIFNKMMTSQVLHTQSLSNFLFLYKPLFHFRLIFANLVCASIAELLKFHTIKLV